MQNMRTAARCETLGGYSAAALREAIEQWATHLDALLTPATFAQAQELDTLRAQLAEQAELHNGYLVRANQVGRAQAIAEVKMLVDRLSYEPADAYSSPTDGQGVVDAGLLRVKLDALAPAPPASVTPEPPREWVCSCGAKNYKDGAAHCWKCRQTPEPPRSMEVVVDEMLRLYSVPFTDANSRAVAIATWTNQLRASEARPTTEDDDEPTHANKPKAQQERSQSESACCTKTSATSAGQGQAESPKASVVVTDLSPSPPPEVIDTLRAQLAEARAFAPPDVVTPEPPSQPPNIRAGEVFDLGDRLVVALCCPNTPTAAIDDRGRVAVRNVASGRLSYIPKHRLLKARASVMSPLPASEARPTPPGSVLVSSVPLTPEQMIDCLGALISHDNTPEEHQALNQAIALLSPDAVLVSRKDAERALDFAWEAGREHEVGDRAAFECMAWNAARRLLGLPVEEK